MEEQLEDIMNFCIKRNFPCNNDYEYIMLLLHFVNSKM